MNDPMIREVEGHVRGLIREFPDWPKEGVNFIDASLVYADPKGFMGASILIGEIGRAMFEASDEDADYLLCPDARGFILGGALAHGMSFGLVAVRKGGKTPGPCLQATYQLEYGEDVLQIPMDAIPSGASVLIYDDLLATGGTAEATARLALESGATVAGFLFLMELSYLDGRRKLENAFDVPVGSALTFDH